MAHTGKFWPLHFRRDWSVQVRNNRDGWGNQYDVTTIGLQGTVGHQLNGLHISCHEPLNDKNHSPYWDSIPFHLTGGMIRYHLDAFLKDEPPEVAGLRLTISIDGVNKFIINSINDFINGYTRKVLPPSGVIAETPGILFMQTGASPIFATVVPWP